MNSPGEEAKSRYIGIQSFFFFLKELRGGVVPSSIASAGWFKGHGVLKEAVRHQYALGTKGEYYILNPSLAEALYLPCTLCSFGRIVGVDLVVETVAVG